MMCTVCTAGCRGRACSSLRCVWQLDPQAASALVNFGSRGGAFELEADHPTADRALLWRGEPSSAFEPLTALGHKIDRDAMVSGLHIIARTNLGGRVGADS
jgi:hypothetical protein